MTGCGQLPYEATHVAARAHLACNRSQRKLKSDRVLCTRSSPMINRFTNNSRGVKNQFSHRIIMFVFSQRLDVRPKSLTGEIQVWIHNLKTNFAVSW